LNPDYVPSALIGKPMPKFSLPTLTDPNSQLSSDALQGKVALVNVWGTWCVECRHEHAFLVTLAQAGVPIYGLNLRDDRASAMAWLATLGNPYVASGFDPQGVAAVDWGVTGAPETFLIGRDGNVIFKHISPLTPLVWSRDFLPLIEQQCRAGDCKFLAAAGGR
jgi:cytochrome c biogenesis protein CcmG/thiol:disulfide interchange protein DsbE